MQGKVPSSLRRRVFSLGLSLLLIVVADPPQSQKARPTTCFASPRGFLPVCRRLVVVALLLAEINRSDCEKKMYASLQTRVSALSLPRPSRHCCGLNAVAGSRRQGQGPLHTLVSAAIGNSA